jgi:hypothetical protein
MGQKFAATKCIGELVYWSIGKRGWLEGRGGESLCLIQLLDAASGHIFARFTRENSAQENLHVFLAYIQESGVPLTLSTNASSLFTTARRKGVSAATVYKPTRVAEALGKLGIDLRRTPKLRGVPRGILSPSRVVQLKADLRLAGASNLDGANERLIKHFLPRVQPANIIARQDAHRLVDFTRVQEALICSKLYRRIGPDRTFRFQGRRYRISVGPAGLELRGREIQLLLSPDGHFTVSFEGGALNYIEANSNPPERRHRRPVESRRPPATPRQRAWMQDFMRRRVR